MRLRLRWFALSLASWCCVLSGQTFVVSGQSPAQSNPQARHTVAGTVVNAVTGEPIRRALVRIAGAPQQLFAFTGEDGRFQMENVPEGSLSITAQKPGFFDRAMNGAVVTQSFVAIGSTDSDVVLKLIPEAKIQGRIVDSDGEPVEGVGVELLAQDIMNGRKRWQQRGVGSTNENGVYHIDNLPEGQYVIRSESHQVFPGVWNSGPDGKLIPEVYRPQFYPNAPDLSAAQPIEVKAGEQGEADFTLTAVRSFKISGTAVGAQNGVSIECLDSNGMRLPTPSGGGRRPGSFVIMQVPAGSWTIRFNSNDGQGRTYFAEQAVDLSTSDIKGLQVQLEPLPSIPVHIVNGSDGRNNVQLQLVTSSGWQPGSFGAITDPSGSLAFHDVLPGVYKLSAQVFGQGCIESIMSGSTDLTRTDLTVSAGSTPAPIEVSLLKDCATISGSITGKGEPVNGFVVLVPESSSTQPTMMPVQGDGKFTLANLSPGGYRLYAFSDVTGLEYANPDTLRDFPSQEVEVTAGQQAQVELELISRGEK